MGQKRYKKIKDTKKMVNDKIVEYWKRNGQFDKLSAHNIPIPSEDFKKSVARQRETSENTEFIRQIEGVNIIISSNDPQKNNFIPQSVEPKSIRVGFRCPTASYKWLISKRKNVSETLQRLIASEMEKELKNG